MTDPSPDVVVLRGQAHGRPIVEFVDALRDRCPERTIRAADTPAREHALVREAPVVVGGAIEEDLLANAEQLRMFACSSAGVGHLPMDALAEHGVTVTNASGVHGPNIAEHVLGSMLVLTRRLDEGIRRQQDHEWRHFQAFGELNESTVTVVGLGPIGETIVERLSGFDVETIGVRYTPEKGGPTDEVIGFADEPFHDALARTDYLVLACPLTDTTRGLVDRDALQTLPTDAFLVNIARGPVVDTDALTHALQSNGIEGAALDVTDPEPLPADHPLWEFENTLITPHVAGDTAAYWTRLADIVAENLDRIDDSGTDENLRNQVLP